jgi:hypothetical protein
MAKCPICKENRLLNDQKICDKCLWLGGKSKYIYGGDNES